MTRRQQWLLLAAIVIVGAGAIGLTTYGLRDEIFPVDVGVKAPDFEAQFRQSLQRVYTYRKQVLAIFDGLVLNEQNRPRIQ